MILQTSRPRCQEALLTVTKRDFVVVVVNLILFCYFVPIIICLFIVLRHMQFTQHLKDLGKMQTLYKVSNI